MDDNTSNSEISNDESQDEDFTDELESLCKELESIITLANKQLDLLEHLRQKITYQINPHPLSIYIQEWAFNTNTNTTTWGEILISKLTEMIS